MIYGYHRVSKKEQKLDRGVNEIEHFCSNKNLPLQRVFTDQSTGKNFERPRYTVLIEDVLRSGDTLIVTELDRLGRNKEETMQQLQLLKKMNIRIMVLELPTTLIDLSTLNNETARLMYETINNIMIELYASIAQMELEKREKRQREGLEAKKKRGEWDDYGRPRKMPLSQFKKEYARVEKGLITPFSLAKELNLTHSTFYRYVKEIHEKSEGD